MTKKRIKFEDLVIGKEYFVECGIWQANVIYCGLKKQGKRMLPYFTFGKCVEDWKNNFGIHSAKSNLKIYE